MNKPTPETEQQKSDAPVSAGVMLEQLLARAEALLAVPEAERTARQRSDLMLLQATLKRAKKAGLIKQGPSSQPRPAYDKGEALTFDGATYWVEKAKADGRLRLVWSGHHHPVGTWMTFKGVAYLVTGAGPRLVMLRIASDADLETEKAALDKVSLDRDLDEFVKVAAVLVEPSVPARTKDGLTDSQRARRERKANRARGEMERKLKRAAARAPAGSIGAGLHTGGY